MVTALRSNVRPSALLRRIPEIPRTKVAGSLPELDKLFPGHLGTLEFTTVSV